MNISTQDIRSEPNRSSQKLASVAVIVPQIVVHHLDPHTGIPFMPHMAAHFAGALDACGCDVQVLDCFGLQPHHREIDNEFMFLGVTPQWIHNHMKSDVQIAFLYCRTVEDLISTERIIQTLRNQRPHLKICLFENIQTVNSFSLREVAQDLLKKGADLAVFGEPERRACVLVQSFLTDNNFQGIAGVSFFGAEGYQATDNPDFDKDLDSLPLPLWNRFPLKGYWQAGFAHAPVKRERFLPILTSRGCPFQCTFCIAPGINPIWRSRSAANVVDEMEYFYKNMNITDFHVSDLDPTINEERTQTIAREIIQRRLPITWKLAQGTKIETIRKVETLELMAQSGCTFVSFSPETGSARLLKIIKKPFNHDHALKMATVMNRLGIRMQACFVAGIPGENDEDRRQSIAYVKKLIKVGVDEIAVTIFTPLPGAKLADALEGYNHYSQCTHSPTWRKDYKEIQKFRYKMYLTFFAHKLQHPGKVLREIRGFLTGQFQTKMEMSIFKQIKLRMLYFFPQMYNKFKAEEILADASGAKDLIGRCP